MNYDIFSNKLEKYIIGDIEWGGFGAMYARRKLILQIAHAFNRIPIFRYTSYIYDDPFKAFDVNLNTLKEKGINEISKFNFTDSEDVAVFFDFGAYWNSPNMQKYQCWHPQEVDYLSYSGFLYNLFKLNDNYTSKVNEQIGFIKEKYEIDTFGNVLALHLRRGDKITESPYLSESFLFETVEKFYDGKKIFVTSDDLDYIYEIENKYPNYDFIYDSDEKRYGDKSVSNAEMVLRNPSLKEQETLTFVKNVEILKQCKYVIGTHSAQMTKIAGSINSFLNKKDNLLLINPENNTFEKMGSSISSS
jgi:hypothetical protein